MRWLSPLLLLSLGLHGLGLFVPVPRKAEVPEEVEELALDSIQVSVLPAEPQADVPVQAAPSEELQQVDPPEVSSQLLASALPDPIVEEPSLSPAKPEPPLVSNQVSRIDASTPIASDAASGQGKPPKSDLFTPQQYDSDSTQYSFDQFSASTAKRDASLVFELVKGEYELDYLGNECFEDTESVESIVGVVVEDVNGRPQIVEGDIIQRTGYAKTDAAVQTWLDDLKSGGEGEGPNLSVESAFGESVYSWIFEQKNRVWFTENRRYESYFFGLVITLVNNTCQ